MNNIICFHNPDEENNFLSNWFHSEFIIDDIKFTSVEQYMMYQKAICFDDKEVATKIMETNDFDTIKSLGRSVSNYVDDIWCNIRKKVVYDAIKAKFSQNEELKRQLLDTGNSILAECAVKDLVWGIGISMKDPNRYNVEKWRGQNLLGYILMEVREELR